MLFTDSFSNLCFLFIGGNVNDGNISNILQITNAPEFHSSGRGRNPNSPSMKTDVCSDEIVKNMRKILDSAVF